MSMSLDQLRHRLAGPLPHPDFTTLEKWSNETVQWALKHFTSLSDQAIGKKASRSAMEEMLSEPCPRGGSDFTHVLADFETKIAPYAFRVNHPRFLAFVPGAPTFISVLGDWLCAGSNFFAGVWLEAAGPSQVELVVLEWFRSMLGFPETTRGILTSGGSEANLTALVVARERLTHIQRSQARLYATDQRHRSVDRAAKIIGLSENQVITVPTDNEFRLNIDALADMITRDRASGLIPWVVLASAGATNTGTIDPMEPLAILCRDQNVWFHVDAAYGWPGILSKNTKQDFQGIASADSITLDPHKWFAQTFDAGCVLIRDGGALSKAFGISADYLQDVVGDEDEINFAECSLALTRRFRALKIWLSVKVLGISWFEQLVEHSCGLAEFAQLLLEQSRQFEIMSPRRLSIICFRYLPDAVPRSDYQIDSLNLALVEELMTSGRAFVSTTRLQGRVALRFCFINWRTTSGDVEEIVQLLSVIGNRLSKQQRFL